MTLRRWLLPACCLVLFPVGCGSTPAPQGIRVDVQPAAPQVLPGGSIDFQATVSGAANPQVTWAVTEASGGTVTAVGHYTAPTGPGTFHVTATSVATPPATATVAVTVTSNPAIGVAVSPHTAALLTGAAATFSAIVTGSADTAVTWSVAAGAGTVTQAGVYTAPLVAGTYNVKTTSHADTSKTDSATVTVTDVTVTVSPHTAVVQTGASSGFTASVSGTSDTAVAWSVVEGAAGGSINSGGSYVAPATPGTYHVTATSHAAPGKQDGATITVLAPGVVVTPPSALVVVSLTKQFAVQLVGATGAVNWSIQEGAAGGTVSATGLYTAPATPGTYHVVATSASDPTKTTKATATVMRTGEWNNVTPAGLTMDPNANPTGNYGAQEVVSDPAHPGTFLVSVTYQGMWRSIDFGATWARISPGNGPMDNGRPQMSISADGSYILSTLLYPQNGFANGCWKSKAPVNGGDPGLGESWRLIPVPSAIPNGDMGHFRTDPGDKDHAIALPHTPIGGFIETVDGGETWTVQTLPKPNGLNTQRLSLIDSGHVLAVYDWGGGVNPRIGTRSGTVWPWTWTFNEVVTKDEAGATSTGQGAFHGAQQIFVDTVNKVGGMNAIYLGGPEGVHRSVDDGATWTKLSTPDPYSEGILATPTTLYSTTSFAVNNAAFDPKFMKAPRNPGSPGSTWTHGATPTAMNNGWLWAATASDGVHHVLVAGCWNAGIWIYIEP